MAITSTFNNGTLSVFGDSLVNTATLGRTAAGQILVNGGAVAVLGGTPTIANTTQIQVFGQAGDDTLQMDETNGALPRANFFGGTGNDLMTGGSGNDQLFGQADNDALQGKGGNDFLFGGDGDDVLTGGTGDDQMFGEAGTDRMVWNPGDGTDLMEGGDGIDAAEVNGGDGAEVFTAVANGTRVRFDRIDPAPFALDIGTTERLLVSMNGGDDVFTGGNGLAALIALSVDGGSGNDTITGGDGADLLSGGDGKDVVTGGRGNDTALLGGGGDVFVWSPGDGNDTVEGQGGKDLVLFNGSNITESVQVQANGSRALVSRDIGFVSMDLDGVERLEINALGGADRFTIGNLQGTALDTVTINLAGVVGGTAGDGAADSVTVNGTGDAEVVKLSGSGTAASVLGLAARMELTGAEGANDGLLVNLLGGDDRFNAKALQAGALRLTVDAGAGDDLVVGSHGNDVLIGGDGNDTVTGGQGSDVAFLGAGNDTFTWRAGDGNDVVEGQDGIDGLDFFGADLAETLSLTANGDRVLLTRDVAAVTIDLHGMEAVELHALGGADSITIGDLTGTGLAQVQVDLRRAQLGDGAADTVTINATQGADSFGVTTSGRKVQVFGSPAGVEILGAEAGLDRLVLNGQGGDDVIDARGLQAGAVQLTMNGGLGNDLLMGSQGGDQVSGGDGNDTALMGGGDDNFVWNPGDDNDIVEGQDGIDTLLFNGANIAETISIAANGGRVLFSRDVAAVAMDLNSIETISFNALGGADTIRIGDLTGTGVTGIVLQLGGTDGAADTVVIQATAGNDVVVVAGGAGGVDVLGLGATIHITGFEAANDRLVINGLGGDDVIDASGLGAGGLLLTFNGGDGNDVLTGGPGNDILNGEAGDDMLIGGLGVDVLNGGLGANILIQ